jgi:hypothetical protein
VKTLRTIFFCLLFVAAVFVSSANVHVVDVVYLPAVGIESTWDPRSIRVPLFVVVLAALILGAILGGATALYEQARLRLALRQARRGADKAASEKEDAQALQARAVAEAVRLRQELADARARLSPPDAQPGVVDDS